jgi:hypothetical protein
LYRTYKDKTLGEIRMNRELDYDSEYESGDELSEESLEQVLQMSLQRENEMMRTYLITAERVHNNDELQNQLRNFAEGNAKRSRQLIDVLNKNL